MTKTLFALLTVLVCSAPLAAEPPAPTLCSDEGCEAAIAPVKFHQWDAWRLTDGLTEAVIVPAIGRVMSFKRIGGQEWLWTAMGEEKIPGFKDWKNWGGEKTWLSPQKSWSQFGTGQGWPPAKEWDQLPYEAEVLTGGKLKLTGAVSSATGARIIREFWHEGGAFHVKQTIEKLRGAPIVCGLWNVTQIAGAKIDAVFLPRGKDSDYEGGFHRLNGDETVVPAPVGETLLQVVPGRNGYYKLGVDAPLTAIAAVRDGEALVQTASRPEGDYPDGAPGKSGTPVQLYGQGTEKMNYLELEILAPMRTCVAGSRWSHTVKWRLEKLPSDDVNDAEVHGPIAKIFSQP